MNFPFESVTACVEFIKDWSNSTILLSIVDLRYLKKFDGFFVEVLLLFGVKVDSLS